MPYCEITSFDGYDIIMNDDEMVDLRKFFKEPQLRLYCELQEILLDLEPSTIDQTFVFIKDNEFLSSEWKLFDLVYFLFQTSSKRVNQKQCFITLFQKIYSIIIDKNNFKKIVQMNLSAAYYFKSYYLTQYIYKMELIKKFPFKPLDTSENKLAEAIEKDDIESLIRISSVPNFNYNDIIMPKSHEVRHLLDSCPTLIQYAAFCGSVSCFKYLLVNNADIEVRSVYNNNKYSILYFAIAGGSYEIIRILEQKNVRFSSTALTASVYNLRNDFFDWLYRTKELKSKKLSSSSLGSFFLHALKSLIITKKLLTEYLYSKSFVLPNEFIKAIIENIPSLDYDKIMWRTIKKGNIILLKYLIDHPKFDTDHHKHVSNPLVMAAMVENQDMLNFLIDHPKIDAESSVSLSLKKQKYSLVEMLVDRNRISVNYIYEENLESYYSMATNMLCLVISGNGSSEFIKKLIDHPNIDLRMKKCEIKSIHYNEVILLFIEAHYI